MTVRIDTLTTEVSVEPEPAPAAAERPRKAMDWEEEAKAASLAARALRDDLRTRARGYDD